MLTTFACSSFEQAALQREADTLLISSLSGSAKRHHRFSSGRMATSMTLAAMLGLLIQVGAQAPAGAEPQKHKVKTFRAFAKYDFVRNYPKFETQIGKCSDFESPPYYDTFRFIFRDGVLTVRPAMEDETDTFSKKAMSLQEASLVARELTHGVDPFNKKPLKPFSATNLKWGEEDKAPASWGWSVEALKGPGGTIDAVKYIYFGQ